MITETRERVTFRKWCNGVVIACLPDNEATPGCMDMYEHVGQHGEGYYCCVVAATTPATPEEYAELLAELSTIGYDLRVVQRIS